MTESEKVENRIKKVIEGIDGVVKRSAKDMFDGELICATTEDDLKHYYYFNNCGCCSADYSFDYNYGNFEGEDEEIDILKEVLSKEALDLIFNKNIRKIWEK